MCCTSLFHQRLGLSALPYCEIDTTDMKQTRSNDISPKGTDYNSMNGNSHAHSIRFISVSTEGDIDTLTAAADKSPVNECICMNMHMDDNTYE